MDDLIAAVQQASVNVPPPLIEQLADAIQRELGPGPRARGEAMRAVAPVSAREAALTICEAWERSAPHLPGAAVALALKSAARAASTIRNTQSIDLVWTGPSTNIPTRATRQALIDLIRAARVSIVLTSFAAYRDQGLLDELNAAAKQWRVSITLVLETAEDSRGMLSQDARYAFDELHHSAAFYVWPLKNRPQQGGVLHAKAAVADRRVALITSANLTAAALDRNMELGVLVAGGPLPLRLDQHFTMLINQQVLVPVQD